MDMVWMCYRRERVHEINWKLLCLASLVKTNKHTPIQTIVWWLDVSLFHKMGCTESKWFPLLLSEGCFIPEWRPATIRLISNTFIGREGHISTSASKWEPLCHLSAGVHPTRGAGGHLQEDNASLALCKVATRKTEKSLWRRDQNRAPGRKPTVNNSALDLINQ